MFEYLLLRRYYGEYSMELTGRVLKVPIIKKKKTFLLWKILNMYRSSENNLMIMHVAITQPQ